jgi:hypothetical protein
MEYTKIPGLDAYGASRTGKIFFFSKNKEMPQYLVGGYKKVNLRHENKTKQYSVHRLVALTYLPQIEGKPEVDHIDRDRQNNCLENLRWVNNFEQKLNTKGRGKNKFITYETLNNNSYFVIYINNYKLHFRKRYNCQEYKLADVMEIRNALLIQYEIPITD